MNKTQVWKLWAVSEGSAKTVGGVFQKFVGISMSDLGAGFFSCLIIGFVQMTSGLVAYTQASASGGEKKAILVPDLKSVLWAVLFGGFATLMTVLGIYTFLLGADLGVRTLLVVSSIVPGAILGALLFPKTDTLTIRQSIGIAIFLVAVWAMLDFPGATSQETIPSWVWWTLLITLSGAINEVLTRKASVSLGPWVNNFWVGTSTLFFCLTGLIVWSTFFGGNTLILSNALLFGSLILGGIVTAMIIFKLLAYKGGGTIALKKLIMQGTYLITVTIAGVLIYDEPLTLGKYVGLLLYFVAFVFTDNSTWKALAGMRFSSKPKTT